MFSPAQEEIIDRFKNPRFAGIVANANLIAVGENPFCGDELRITALVNKGIIKEIKHKCRACAICTASADLLAENLQSQPVTSLQEITAEEVINYLGIPLSPVRLKCALLPLESLKQAQVK